MKNHCIKSLLAIATFIFITFGPVDTYADESADVYEISLEDNINTPAIPTKKQATVKESVSQLKHQLDKAGFSTGRLRQGLALMITLPCSDLFSSNEIVLSDYGKSRLDKLQLLDDYKDKYKILIAVHTDDTGEDGYADSITSERANTINDYLDGLNDIKGMIVVPYGLGRDEPLKPNDSIANRNRNRRVEIYLIPLQTLFSKK